MERSATRQQSGKARPAATRPGEQMAEDRTELAPDIESVSLPPFFALSPGWKQLAARMRALLGRAAPSR
jgi:hypothetical protein